MFQVLGALVAFLLVLVGQFWLMAQIDPPGGRVSRIITLAIMILIAFGFAATVYNGPIDYSD